MARAIFLSLEITLALRPYSESFANRTASLSVAKALTATTGPNISSRHRLICSVTPVNIVGAIVALPANSPPV